MTSKGITLLELVVGIAIAATLSLVATWLFKAGMVTYQYSSRQLLATSRARQAVNRNGRLPGLLWSAQTSAGAAELNVSTLRLEFPAQPELRYYVNGSALFQEQAGSPFKQADGVRELRLAYYNMNSSGQIVVSTAANSATLVVANLSLAGCQNGDCPFFSGAVLRNRP